MSRKEVRLSPLLWHRKSCPRLSGSTIFMLIIRDSFDIFGLGALGGSLGFLLGALGGSLGLTSGPLGCSAVSLGALLASFWMLLRLSSPPIRCSRVLQNDLLTAFASQTPISLLSADYCYFGCPTGGFGSAKSSQGRFTRCETTSTKRFDRDETRREAIN